MSSASRPPADPLLQLRTLAAAILGGLAAHLLHVPLAWMIGAMLGTAALAWRARVAVPAPARPAALIVLGLAFGQTFTAPVLAALAGAVPAILAAGLLAIAAGVLVARLFRRLAGTDPRTSYLCAVPGGVIVMAVLAQGAGASVATVTLAQTVRVVVVVLLFPPLLSLIAARAEDAAFTAARLPPVEAPGLLGLLAAGLVVALAVRRTGVANPWMLGPCLLAIGLSAGGVLPSGVPRVLTDTAQVGMGATLGARLSRDFLLGSRRLALAALLSTLALSVLLTLLAVALALVSGLPVAAVVLGMAPGGMPEMAITAKALDLAVPLVLGFHLTRTLMCNLLVGPIWRVVAALGWVR